MLRSSVCAKRKKRREKCLQVQEGACFFLCFYLFLAGKQDGESAVEWAPNCANVGILQCMREARVCIVRL